MKRFNSLLKTGRMLLVIPFLLCMFIPAPLVASGGNPDGNPDDKTMIQVSPEKISQMMAYDNLGNHTATQNLTMGIYGIGMGNGCRFFQMKTVSNNQFQMGDFNGCIGPPAFSNIVTIVYSGTGYGNVRIGYATSTPTYQLQLTKNSAGKPGSSTWSVISDRRLKKDIATYTEGLAELRRIEPVTYQYNGKAGIDTDERFVGVIAQDLQEVAPHMIKDFNYIDEDKGIEEKYLSVDMNALQYMELNAIKELDQELQAQREINANLQRELTQLRETVNQLVATQSGKGQVEPVNSFGRLEQNAPNPFTETTRIGYTLPNQVDRARIVVTDLNGETVRTFTLKPGGAGHVTLDANQLSAGAYFYKLEVDGRTVDARQMLLTN